MTITRIWQSGIETGSLAEFMGTNGAGLSVSTAEKTGTYAFQITTNVSNGWGNVTVPATRQIRFGFQIYLSSSYSGTDFIVVRDAGANNLLTLENDGADDRIELFVEDVSKDSAAGEMVYGTYVHIGIDMKVDSSAGWVKVYKDGNEILSFAGDTGNADIFSVLFGHIAQNPETTRYDDMYVDDTTGEGAAAVCPILYFYYVVPDGIGNYTQWTPSTGNNWSCVDEKPPNTGDYVETAIVDKLDSYTMTTYALGSGEEIVAIIPIAYTQREGATEELALGTRYSGTDLIGSDQAPPGSWDYLWERQTTKPGGGAWTQAALDEVEALIKSRGTF